MQSACDSLPAAAVDRPRGPRFRGCHIGDAAPTPIVSGLDALLAPEVLRSESWRSVAVVTPALLLATSVASRYTIVFHSMKQMDPASSL